MKSFPLHRRTRSILSQVSAELGTEIPWADCFAEISGLDEAVRKCFEPAELDCIEMLDQPVVVGGTKFWALTLNASDWFEEWCRKFPESPEMQIAGWLYASAHSMDPDALLRTWNDKYKLAWHVWLWRARCGVKSGQIAPLQSLLMPETPWARVEETDGEVEKEGYSAWGWLIATLCRLKNDPDWWRNKVPFLKALQNYKSALLYGETDAKIKDERWEKWQSQAQLDEMMAIRRLKKAWKAFDERSGRKRSVGTSEGVGGQEGASPREETGNAAAPAPEEMMKKRMNGGEDV